MARAAGPAATVHTGSVGYRNDHRDPRTGSLTQFGVVGGFALDCLHRSVGVDLGEARPVNAIELLNSRDSHGLTTRELSVHISDDNRSWMAIPADFLDLGTSIWLYGVDVRARYVAVHCHADGPGAAATFINTDLQAVMRVHHLPAGSFTGHGGGQWTARTRLRVQNPTSQTLRDRCAHISLAALGVPTLVRNGDLAPNLADLRFADESGRQLHAFADDEGVFVRIPLLGPGAVATIHAHSGNPEATTVLDDADALGVEYGRRTFQSQAAKSAAGLAFGSQLAPVRLPDGTLMVAAGTTAAGGIHARYSFDGGRTWTTPEPLIRPSDPTRGTDQAGSLIVDPDTGTVTAFLFSVGRISGTDWTDPSQHLCQVWTARAEGYRDRRPVFEAPVLRPILNHETGQPCSWAVTYSPPVVTPTGAYVVAVPYIFRSDGAFAAAMLRSIDRGITWTQSATPLTTPLAGFEGGISESAITVQSNGDLVVHSRQQHYLKFHFATSRSTDDGVTWTAVEDSSVLASNTHPTALRRADDLLLGWSGHNALGQKSYWRNNFTLAWSVDGQRRYGYHDLTAATPWSTPGLLNAAEQRRVVQAFLAPASDDDLVIAMATGLTSGGTTMLVEDATGYLHHSHGAADALRHHDASAVAAGRELARERWWRTSPGGTLSLTPGPVEGRSAITLHSEGTGIGASRIFPGARSARIRFRLRWRDLSGGLRIALQEAFASTEVPNVGTNARGTVLQLAIGPTGEVTTTTEDVYDAVAVGGYREDDLTPGSGDLNLFVELPVAFDYQSRSVGLDLQQARAVESLTMVGLERFAIDQIRTRLEPGDLRLWTSSSNNGDWQLVPDWSCSKDGLTFTFRGPTLTTRFLKVTQPYADKAFSYANDLEKLVQVGPARPDLDHPQTWRPLDVATTLSPDRWHRVEIAVDLDHPTVALSLNGSVVSTTAPLRAAETITHLMVLGNGTTDADLAEFTMQDTGLGLPILTRTGRLGQS